MAQVLEVWFVAGFDFLTLKKIQSKTKLLAFLTQVSLSKYINYMNDQNQRELILFSNHLCSNVNIQVKKYISQNYLGQTHSGIKLYFLLTRSRRPFVLRKIILFCAIIHLAVWIGIKLDFLVELLICSEIKFKYLVKLNLEHKHYYSFQKTVLLAFLLA